VIRKEAWPFYRTISGVCLWWELEEPKGPKGLPHLRNATSRKIFETCFEKVPSLFCSDMGSPFSKVLRDRIEKRMKGHTDEPAAGTSNVMKAYAERLWGKEREAYGGSQG